jgi:GNAT superfamily N-acetyltransferase
MAAPSQRGTGVSDFTFRDARPQDIPDLLALSDAGHYLGAAHVPQPDTYGDARYRQAFDEIISDPAHRLIVVEMDSQVVGTCQITVLPGLPNFGLKRGLLENVQIRPDKRGTGIGKRLVAHAIEICRERGCGVVQLTSNKVRLDAHRFYRRLGFEQSHEGFKLKL